MMMHHQYIVTSAAQEKEVKSTWIENCERLDSARGGPMARTTAAAVLGDHEARVGRAAYAW